MGKVRRRRRRPRGKMEHCGAAGAALGENSKTISHVGGGACVGDSVACGPLGVQPDRQHRRENPGRNVTAATCPSRFLWLHLAGRVRSTYTCLMFLPSECACGGATGGDGLGGAVGNSAGGQRGGGPGDTHPPGAGCAAAARGGECTAARTDG
eukprot:gene16178-biopygen6741